MKMRAIALASLFGLALLTQTADAQTADGNQSGWGWGSGMMGGNWGSSMMGGGWGRHGWGSGSGMMMGGGCGMMGGGNSGSNYNTYVDGRIAFLQTELGITTTQKPAWTEYTEALRSNSDVMKSMHQQMIATFQQKNVTSTQWLDFHIKMMKSHLSALETLKPATEALYKVLSKDQQQKADRLLPAMGCM